MKGGGRGGGWSSIFGPRTKTGTASCPERSWGRCSRSSGSPRGLPALAANLASLEPELVSEQVTYAELVHLLQHSGMSSRY